MERVIYKFTLSRSARQTIKIQRNAKILSFQMQFALPTIWAEVDPKATMEVRTIVMFDTGESFSAKEGTRLFYLGTLQFHGGNHIYHFYEETEY